VHRGTGQHSLASTELFEKAREIILEYFGFNKKDYIVVFGDQKRITALREKIGSKYEHRNICSKDLGLALGVSVLVVHKSDLPKDVKDYTGGGTVKLVTKKFIVWADAPDVFEAGTPNIVGVILFAKALKIISKTGNAHIFNPFYTDLLSIDSVSEVVSKTIFMDGLTGVYGKDLLDRVKNLLIGKGVKVPTKDGDKPYINLDN
jgi:selenocysteine lyase/cysteine desulfurase